MTEHPDIAIWIQSGLIGVMVIALGWVIKGWIKGMNDKISKMWDELRVIGNKNIGFEKDIQGINSRIDRDYASHEHRLQDHADRVRDLEQKQASCRNCVTK